MLASDKGLRGPELEQLCSNRKRSRTLSRSLASVSALMEGIEGGWRERSWPLVGAPLTQGGAPSRALFREPSTRGT